MRSCGSCAFSFTRNCKSISQSGCTVSHPHQGAEDSQAWGYTNLTPVVEHAPLLHPYVCWSALSCGVLLPERESVSHSHTSWGQEATCSDALTPPQPWAWETWSQVWP